LQLLLMLGSALILISCSSEDGKSSLNENLKYEIVKYQKKSERCDSLQNQNCAEIKIEFPKIAFPANKIVEEKINKSITELFSQDIFGSTESSDFEVLMNGFIQDYESFKQEFTEASQSWAVERSGEVRLNKAGVFSIDYTEYAYTGGAHPNTFVSFKNFSLNNGEEISIDELFTLEKQQELTKIAEKEFRQLKQLGPEDDLGSAGFWFENNKFSLNDNFLITDKGLLFYYNSYEITAYAFGPTELELPNAKIKTLIEEKSILGDLVK
ncbi:MAG: DUF3298 and DUF4163 domain-containing protein, partial [Ignavibacteriaceae bacterium]